MSIQDAPGPHDSVAPAPTPIWLVIEQNVGGADTTRWGVEDPRPLPPGTTQAQARQRAVALARTFRPRHPMMENGRTVLRLTDDSYLTIVQGATATFHFRVSLCEPI